MVTGNDQPTSDHIRLLAVVAATAPGQQGRGPTFWWSAVCTATGCSPSTAAVLASSASKSLSPKSSAAARSAYDDPSGVAAGLTGALTGGDVTSTSSVACCKQG